MAAQHPREDADQLGTARAPLDEAGRSGLDPCGHSLGRIVDAERHATDLRVDPAEVVHDGQALRHAGVEEDDIRRRGALEVRERGVAAACADNDGPGRFRLEQLDEPVADQTNLANDEDANVPSQ